MLKSIHSPIRRITISTLVAIAAIAGSATISHSQSVQTFGPFPSMAACEAHIQALRLANPRFRYWCEPLPGRQEPKKRKRLSGGSNRPQNQSGKSSNELTPKEIAELRKTFDHDIPPELLRDPKVRRAVRDYLEAKRNASAQPYLSNPSIQTRILDRSTEELRNQPGKAYGGSSLPNVTGRLLPDGRIGLIPGQIARKMRGMRFKNFKEFRKTFWKLVAQDPHLKKGWKNQDLESMQQGKPPGAIEVERTGGKSNAVLQLDHSHDLQHGGGLYDLDSIRIVTPRFHQEYGRD